MATPSIICNSDIMYWCQVGDIVRLRKNIPGTDFNMGDIVTIDDRKENITIRSPAKERTTVRRIIIQRITSILITRHAPQSTRRITLRLKSIRLPWATDSVEKSPS